MGHCDASSNCITQCTEVPGQSQVQISAVNSCFFLLNFWNPLSMTTIVQCGSPECIRPNACPSGDPISNWDSVAKLCFVANEVTIDCISFANVLFLIKSIHLTIRMVPVRWVQIAIRLDCVDFLTPAIHAWTRTIVFRGFVTNLYLLRFLFSMNDLIVLVLLENAW